LLPPHSSDQTQPYDVGVFGALKANMTHVHPVNDLSKQSKQVLKILGAAASYDYQCISSSKD
jgi:hypothetical protein